MLRPWLVVALFLSLAGCSSGPESAPAEPTATTTAATTETGPPAKVELTDTVHFLDAPHLAATLPVGGEVIRTPIRSDLDGVGGGETFTTWTLPRPDLAELLVDFHLVVEVQGAVTPYSYTTNGRACFWSIQLHFVGENALDGPGYCIQEPVVVPTGIRTLEFSMGMTDLAAEQGEQLAVSISTSGVYSPGATVELLSGTVDADSTMNIAQLQWPLDMRTL